MTSTPDLDRPAGEVSSTTMTEPKLAGTMTTFDIVFTVLAFNAPLADFVGYLTVIIGYANGLGTPSIFIAAGLLVFVFAAGFTTMSKHLPNPGAFYAYVTAGLGKPLGLGAAFLAIASYVFLYVSSYIYGGTSLTALVSDVFHGPHIDWWVFNVALIVICGVLGYFRITLSARILTAAMVLEVVLIVIYDTVVFVQGGHEGFTSSAVDPHFVFSGSLGLAALFGIGMFSGFEATAIFREEARDPERTIPRATYIMIGVIAVLYGITSYALIVGVGPSTVVASAAADPTGTAIGTVDAYLGTVGKDLVVVLLCSSVFAAILAMHNITARYLFSMGRDGVFPRALGKVHASHGSPYIASATTTGLAVLFLIGLLISKADNLTVYARLAGIALYALIMLLLMTSAAIAAYFWVRPDHGLGKWKTLYSPVIAGIGFVVALVLATQNASFLVGGSKSAATILIVFFFAMVVVGAVYAIALRSTRPDVYARIGRQDL
ncbi:MAG: Amino acid permease-associated region [Nocardioidaceae bacterium]|nr:Amino acid permease-associated region [Nocardioidaceae bacterium]